MTHFTQKNSQILQQLMQKVGISTIQDLSQVSGLSEWQIQRLQFGLLPKMSVESLLKLAAALQVSVETLLTSFLSCSLFPQDFTDSNSTLQEYQRLEAKFTTLESDLQEKLLLWSLDILESWLIYWPTAIVAAEKNPSLPAKKIIPLVKPVQQLVESWGLQAIASVGEEIPYNPQFHQLIEGVAQEGDLVKVRNVGYRRGDQLHLKVKVSPR
jgi:transcriptional regulator with XRE-family HTH domain